MNYTKANDSIGDKITAIEKKVGVQELTDDELCCLLDMVELKNEHAIFTYGLYLLLEKKDEKAAIEWINKQKPTHNKNQQ